MSPSLLSITLEDAVGRMVGLLCDRRVAFSAHDVTALLREAVNMGGVELAGCTKSFQTAVGPLTMLTYEIEHPRVRRRVSALHSAGAIAGYVREKRQSTRTGLDYWLYSPQAGAVRVGGLAALGVK